ncbi:NADH:ubiquinone reductase (Na(+)-transporting) subunit F [Flexivirga oryzae]|uniref:Phenol hydroxylase P5 protein n=1 Tax=Flexivirga oryzae TaxID=1794944 RepID=A0A839N8K1_9MICO|nr:2Fe-2S iron-sulfur cluster binding domain-containing protein [Flexivirga oryzae]MBB2891956.1 phenol hydroxylase P5 protein [Flexivirga oryzae]
MVTTHTVTVEPIGRQIACREDQNLLDACLRNGIWMPHSCTHGTCATCKADLLDGDVDHGDASAFALMDFERTEGKLLLCQACPRSDVTIEGDIEAEEGLEFSPVRDFVGTVTEISDIARETRLVRIGLDSPMEFSAGQYVSITVPGQDCTRTYSMANPPSQPEAIELNIRRTPGGLASDGWVFKNLAVGDQVELSGPYGRFVFRPAREEKVIMIAGGTGLAPILSMIRHILSDPSTTHELHLFQGARQEVDLYAVEELRSLAAQHPDRLHYYPCLSDEEWDGPRGLVTEVLDEQFDRLREHVAYVCGPPPMVQAATKLLMRKRLFPRDIFHEDFFDESDKNSGGLKSPLLKH